MDDYDAFVEFLLLGCYPSGLSKDQKSSYRRKAQESYKVHGGGCDILTCRMVIEYGARWLTQKKITVG